MRDLGDPIKELAASLGFSSCGIVPAQPSARLAAYLNWLKAGMHGEMTYLARPDRVARREDMSLILPGARSLIVVTLDYGGAALPDTILRDPARGRISNYAWGGDYHDLMLDRLARLAAWLETAVGSAVAARAYVDTGAVLERAHAEQAGLGFVGKNTMLIAPRRGSFFFLGEIITDLPLTYDTPAALPGCGSCARCLKACPTGAFPRPYTLDARRCISYLTIEVKEAIPVEMRPLMSNWVYGCDICQEVCPWQRFVPPQIGPAFGQIHPDDAAPFLSTLLMLDDAAFERRYAGTAIFRVKRDRLVRNACVAAGNSKQPELAASLLPLLEDPNPILRGHAAWALGQLSEAGAALERALARETDERVRQEMSAALRERRE